MTITKGTCPNVGKVLTDYGQTTVPSDWETTTIAPNFQVNGGNAPGWTLTFTLRNNTDAEMTITGLGVAAFTYNSAGQPQSSSMTAGNGPDGHKNPTISGGYQAGQRWANVAVSVGDVSYTLGSATSGILGQDKAGDVLLNGKFAVNDLTFGDSTFELAAGESVNITVALSSSQYTNDGAYVGLAGMTLNYTLAPEPTTATLSLLALAGLCVRRRRK